jgi:thiamine-monophosphate kinase
VGDAAAGLAQLRQDRRATGSLVDIYRRPVPLLIPGKVLAEHATAMMDVSDGLLLDARKLAEASGCVAEIEMDALPLSEAFKHVRGVSSEALLFAATGGDDYALLAALPADLDPVSLSLPSGTTIERIGKLDAGTPAIRLFRGGSPVAVPETLGYEHRGSLASPHFSPPLADRP